MRQSGCSPRRPGALDGYRHAGSGPCRRSGCGVGWATGQSLSERCSCRVRGDRGRVDVRPGRSWGLAPVLSMHRRVARNMAGTSEEPTAPTAPEAAQLVVDRLACNLVGEERAVTAIPGYTYMTSAAVETVSSASTWCNYRVVPLTSIPDRPARPCHFRAGRRCWCRGRSRIHPITRSSLRHCPARGGSLAGPAAHLIVQASSSPPSHWSAPDYGTRTRFTTTFITLAPGIVGESSCVTR